MKFTLNSLQQWHIWVWRGAGGRTITPAPFVHLFSLHLSKREKKRERELSPPIGPYLLEVFRILAKLIWNGSRYTWCTFERYFSMSPECLILTAAFGVFSGYLWLIFFRLYWHKLKTLNYITKLIMFSYSMSAILDELAFCQNEKNLSNTEYLQNSAWTSHYCCHFNAIIPK